MKPAGTYSTFRPIMDTKNNQESKQPDKPKQIVDLAERILNPNKSHEKSEEKPPKKIKRKATQEQLNNPLHGVKLAQILERLVDYYGWEYLADVVNIRCFKYNPTMKSSLGFLRKMQWAREHVEDVYLDMLDERGDANGIFKF